MKKRILAFVLCICLMLPLFVGGVFATGERTATAYDGDIGRTAIFNSYYFDGGSFFISDAPENESGWAMSARIAANEDFSDLLFVITDVRVVEKGEGVPSEYWYKVEAAEGYVLPAELTEKPWIFQNVEGDSPDYDSLIVDRTSGLAETDPEEEQPEEPEEEQPVESENGLALLEEGSEEGTSEAEWISYSDWIIGHVEKIFNDPGMYVGYEAVFDTVTWVNFQFAKNPSEAVPADDENWIYIKDIVDEQENVPHIIISDYATDAEGRIWYKIEAAEGYSLPEELLNNPYVLCVENEYDPPALIVLPLQGMFIGETVDIRDKAVEATKTVTLNTADLPEFFDLTPADIDGFYYDLGDVSDWYSDTDVVYRYVKAESVILIAPEVTVAYEKLKNAETAREFEEIWENLPEDIRNQFTSKHIEILDKKHEEISNVEKNCTVDYNGKTLNVSVTGAIPANVELFVEPVSAETVLAEGFDVKNATEIITALDIKLLYGDYTEWQPEDGEYVELAIDMAALGVPDNTVVRLHHKHGDKINIQEVFVVMDGKLTILTGGFSLYIVDDTTDTYGTRVDNGGTVNVDIGETTVFYFASSDAKGTWIVDDPTGSIHYTVHSNDAESEDIGHRQVSARWIRVVGLKKTPDGDPVTLTYTRGNNTETFYLNVNVPEADTGKKKLYIKDEVNTTGCIVAAVVDDKGNEVSLEGAAFTWSRRDDINGNVFIVPAAYERKYQAVNIARDHGGLVEARKDNNRYAPTTYTLDVILSDGTELSADYTVYYQSEIINAGFEFPDSKRRDYSFFPNGYPELYWKTTAPGLGTENITKDIEYGDVTGLNQNSSGETNYGVWRAADWQTNGVQFAELNAEEVGALYQDIITAPLENIEWDFCHAARPDQPGWAPDVHNEMYLVIGPTEEAQKLDNEELNNLVREAREEGGSNNDFLTCQTYVKIMFKNAEYWVWYHNADRNDQPGYNQNPYYGWAKMEGSYTVPEKQYRTRVFFVSDPDATNGNNKKAGNLIDVSSAGQYKKYLIEYYEQTYKNGELETNRMDEYKESGEALIYSSAELKNYDYFINEKYAYLYKIMINGKNYPYDIRYSNKATLYIEKYEGKATDPLGGNEDYSDYDIVMQVFLRDTVVAVQKELEFPVDDKGNQLLTEEQKLTIIENLNKEGGYKAKFKLTSTDLSTFKPENEEAVITARDPAGKYKGFVALGENPTLGHSYQVEETAMSKIPGLELSKVKFGVTRYSLGAELDEINEVSYTEIEYNPDQILKCNPFKLEGSIKIADVNVVNTYREKETTIYYKAIGNGKVALAGQTTNFEDTPTETLAFYSGKSDGVEIHKGAGAIFAGWFKDESCSEESRVTPADGVVDPVTGTFTPNANIINADEITFYAKFTTASIVIERENGEPGQSFVYHVTNNKEGKDKVDFYLTIVCGEDKKGSAIITEVPAGEYTITEIPDWSWRFKDPPSQTVTVKADADINHLEQTVTFIGDVDKPYWFSGLAEIAKNIFKGVSSS